MTVANHFDLTRFSRLLKLEFFRSRKAIVMTLVIILGLLFFVGMLLEIMVERKIIYTHHQNYRSALLVGGFILSSLAFNDLSSVLRRYHYLTLPASAFEKVLCMWLFTCLGWLTLFTVAFSVYALVANPVGGILFRSVIFTPFNPLSEYAITSMQYYFVLQGIFLVGAAHFRGYVLAKTLVALVMFALLTSFIAYFILYDSFLIEHECTLTGECEIVREIERHPVWQSIHWVFWWLFAPLCWIVTYVAVKEKES